MIDHLEIERWMEHARKTDSVLLDIRSEGEHAQGHVPGAISFPLLNNEERHQVGITYRQQGQQEAVKKGFALVGHKFADYISKAEQFAVSGEVLIYCWRGGMRSNIMAWLLDLAGFRIKLLSGGYKSYRHFCLEHQRLKNRILVVTGKTGSGKTEVLKALHDRGEQVLDLEFLASHKGSAFGALGQPEAPTQEHFENMIGWQLSAMNHAKIWVEGESRFIGKLRIPDAMYDRMMNAETVELERSFDERINRIIAEYGDFPTEILQEKTLRVRKRMGGENVKESIDALLAGDLIGWVKPLLVYYDKTYTHSNEKNQGKKLFGLDITGKEPAAIADMLATTVKEMIS
jgi:tRNA 2-selenouridine synthase